MRRTLPALLLLVALHLSMGATAQSSVAGDIAPAGRLRAALIGTNPVLVTRHADGTLGGVSVELGRLIATRLGVPFEPAVYKDTDSYAKSFGTGQWDVALGPRTSIAEAHCDFSPDFMIVDNIYVALPGREFASAAEVDRAGVKIAVVLNGAPDQYLTKALKSAQLVRVAGGTAEIVETLRGGKADVYGSNAENVHKVAGEISGAKILPGAFRSVRMAVAYPKGRSAAAQARIAEIVNEAKSTGLVQASIDRGNLKGVRLAP